MERLPQEFRIAQQLLGLEDTPQEKQAQDLAAELGNMPFWCGDRTIHTKKPDTYMDEKCCVTHTVGLPRHPATNEEMPLTPYQEEFVHEIMSATKPPKAKKARAKFLRRHHFFHVKKGRQMGFTEIVLRLIQYYAFNRYAGYNIGIIAATNGSLARKDLRRFARLFKHIPYTVQQWIRNSNFVLANGTVVEAFAASEEGMTGDTRYKCIFMDEAAKWKLVDDSPVFNSVEPISRSSGGDLFLVSTPKGPIKKFYKIDQTPDSEYQKLVYDIWRSEGNMRTKAEIETMLASKTSDPNQEYLCKYTVAEDAVFGTIGDDDRGKNWSTWDQAETEPETDSYKEDNTDWGDIHEDE